MQTENQTVDGESVKIIRTEPMSIERTVADITDQTEHGLALFEERVRVAKKQLGIALKLTQPGQWMTYGEGNKQSVYATAGAADRILRMGFGMRWSDKRVTIEKDSDGVTATARASLLKHDGSAYEEFEGKRRMVYDAESAGGVKGYIKDEANLIKSALANLAHVAVTQILGLRFLSPSDFAELGMDLGKLTRHVEFQEHDKDESGGLTVPFGKNKGKSITELADKSLDWYIEAAQKAVADPAKAKWRGKEERWLTALLAERDSRLGKASPSLNDMPAWDGQATNS